MLTAYTAAFREIVTYVSGVEANELSFMFVVKSQFENPTWSPQWEDHISQYRDVIMSTMVSQITSPTIVCSTIYSDAYQRKHQIFASLAFVRGIHRHHKPLTTTGILENPPNSPPLFKEYHNHLILPQDFDSPSPVNQVELKLLSWAVG